MRCGDGKTAVLVFVSDPGDASHFFNDAGEHGISFVSPQRHREVQLVQKHSAFLFLCLCASVVKRFQSAYGSFKYPSTAKSSPKRCRRIDFTRGALLMVANPGPPAKGTAVVPPDRK